MPPRDGSSRGAHRLTPVFWLLAAQLVMYAGVAALFPVAPLYVAHRGGGALAIALFVAGPLAANTLVQVPAGRLVDRIGRRPVLLGTRLAYGLIAMLLFADVGPLWLLAVLRMLQGAASGAYVPALMAALTDLSAPGERTRRFAQVQAVEMIGLLIGPLFGGAAALWRDSAAFGVTGVLILLGLVPMWQVPETGAARTAVAQRPAGRWWSVRGLIVPSIGLLAVGTIFAMYDVVWPQYMTARGYNTFVVGLSVSLFAVPILLLFRYSARIAERVEKRLLVPIALIVTALCAGTYPFLHALSVILVVGTVEAVAFVFLEPSLYAVIGDAAHESARGRAMGVGGFFYFGGSAIGAAVLGAVYGLGERYSFWSGAGLLLVATVVCAIGLPQNVRAGGPREVPPTLPMREGDAV